MAAITAGSVAPNFALDATTGEQFTLSTALKTHRFAVLIFYPLAFSPVCTDELAVFQEAQEEFARLGAITVGISVDSKYAQAAFAKQHGLTFPLLADFHPKGAVAAQFGVLREDGISERALFIVAAGMTVQYSYVSDVHTNPGADSVLARLDQLQAG